MPRSTSTIVETLESAPKSFLFGAGSITGVDRAEIRQGFLLDLRTRQDPTFVDPNRQRGRERRGEARRRSVEMSGEERREDWIEGGGEEKDDAIGGG